MSGIQLSVNFQSNHGLPQLFWMLESWHKTSLYAMFRSSVDHVLVDATAASQE